jgi:hypothetical protein
VSSFVACVRDLLEDADRRNTFGARGRQIVEEDFNVGSEAARFVDVMIGAVSKGTAAVDKKRDAVGSAEVC